MGKAIRRCTLLISYSWLIGWRLIFKPGHLATCAKLEQYTDLYTVRTGCFEKKILKIDHVHRENFWRQCFKLRMWKVNMAVEIFNTNSFELSSIQGTTVYVVILRELCGSVTVPLWFSLICIYVHMVELNTKCMFCLSFSFMLNYCNLCVLFIFKFMRKAKYFH